MSNKGDYLELTDPDDWISNGSDVIIIDEPREPLEERIRKIHEDEQQEAENDTAHSKRPRDEIPKRPRATSPDRRVPVNRKDASRHESKRPHSPKREERAERGGSSRAEVADAALRRLSSQLRDRRENRSEESPTTSKRRRTDHSSSARDRTRGKQSPRESGRRVEPSPPALCAARPEAFWDECVPPVQPPPPPEQPHSIAEVISEALPAVPVETRQMPPFVIPKDWVGSNDFRYVKQYGMRVPLPMLALPRGFEWRVTSIDELKKGATVRDKECLDKLWRLYRAIIFGYRKAAAQLSESVLRFHWPTVVGAFCQLIMGLNRMVDEDNDGSFSDVSMEATVSFYLSTVLQLTQLFAFSAYSRATRKASAKKQHELIWRVSSDNCKALAQSIRSDWRTVTPPYVEKPLVLATESMEPDLSSHFEFLMRGGLEGRHLDMPAYFVRPKSTNPLALERGPTFFGPPVKLRTPSAIRASLSTTGSLIVRPYDGILRTELAGQYDQGLRPYATIIHNSEKASELAKYELNKYRKGTNITGNGGPPVDRRSPPAASSSTTRTTTTRGAAGTHHPRSNRFDHDRRHGNSHRPHRRSPSTHRSRRDRGRY